MGVKFLHLSKSGRSLHFPGPSVDNDGITMITTMIIMIRFGEVHLVVRKASGEQFAAKTIQARWVLPQISKESSGKYVSIAQKYSYV